MYVTPHRWTPFYADSAARRVIQPDLSKWDYRHQVLATRRMAWRVFLWVKLTEALVSLRPRALRRVLGHPDPSMRRALRWCFWRSGLVWLDELTDFVFRDRRLRRPAPLTELRGQPEPEKEYVLSVRERELRKAS
jgi:anaerobic magnesium-protoporphyrin IX monomethyl ester cyclase